MTLPPPNADDSAPAIDALLAHHRLWRGRSMPTTWPTLPTGHAALDQLLGGGWPRGALVELIGDHQGIGEVSLLLPALARITQTGRWIAWIAPPHIPYAPALAAAGIATGHMLVAQASCDEDALWACEQALRSGHCGAVLGWPARVDAIALRRLQLAAGHGDAIAFLYRRGQAAGRPSPAALRLSLAPAGNGIAVTPFKQRGNWHRGRHRLVIPWHALSTRVSDAASRPARPR